MNTSESTLPQRLLAALKLLAVALLYALIDRVTLAYLADDGVVSTFWPASGFALAAVLIGGNRYAWGVFLGAIAANAFVPGNSPIMIVGLALAPSLEALLGAWLLKRHGQFDPTFARLSDFMRFMILAGFVAVVLGAVIGTSTLLASGHIDISSYPKNLMHWWMGDALGIILFTPLILVWQNRPKDWFQPKRMLEVAGILTLSLLAGQAIFLGWMHDSIGLYAKGFFMFPLIAFAAARLGIHGTLTILAMIAVQAVLGAIRGNGYFADDIAVTQLVNYWLYMVALSVVGITLATFITTEQRDKEILREQEEFFRMITENIDDLIAVLDLEGRRLYNSPSYAKLFGDPRILQNTDSFAEIHPDDRERVRQIFRDTVATGIGQRIEFRFVLADGTERDMESRGGLIKNSAGKPLHVVVVSHDITERKKFEEKISILAFYDTLTHLPNRRMLSDRLGKAMAASKRSGEYGALMFLDLDNFKPLNDLHGHSVGDLLLIEVAHRISSCVRETDTVARFGGDEFVVMLNALDADKTESIRLATIVAEKIRLTLAEPYLIRIRNPHTHEDQVIEHHCTTSIGAVLFINHEATEEDLIKWADMAMYQAKDNGRNTLHFST